MVWKGCLERPRALTMQQAGGQDCTAEGTTAYPKAWLVKRARIKEGVNGKPQTPVKRDYSHISLNFQTAPFRSYIDRSFGFVSRPLPRPLLVLFTSRIELEFLGLKWCEKSTNCKSSTKALLCLLLSSHAQKVCHSRCRTIMMCLSWLWRTQIEGFPAIKMAMSLLFDCG